MRNIMKAKLFLLIGCLCSLVFVSTSNEAIVQAQSTTILNGDFESGDFTGWTAGGVNDGVARIAQEGTCFSANNTLGLVFDGGYAARIRSSGPAPINSVGVLSSDAFIAGSSITFSALSENDDQTPAVNPVTLEVRILDAANIVLHSEVVVTDVITLAPSEINCATGDPRNKDFSTHVVDTSALEGQTIKVQFRQHTNVPGRGFFTLIDDVSADDGNEPQEIAYFALGDSIASGHGLMDTGTNCRRSPNAFPYKVKETLEGLSFSVHFRHFACSGAVAKSPERPNNSYKFLSNQVTDAISEIGTLPTDMPILVTINIGANDFEWAKPTILLRMYSKQPIYEDWVKRITGDVETAIAQNLEDLLSHPNVVVVLTELYNPFNTGSFLFGLQFPGSRFHFPWRDLSCPSLDCYVRTELAINQLNAAITNQWQLNPNKDRVRIAQINSTFRGHESPQGLCGINSPTVAETWIQYPGDPNSNSVLRVPRWAIRQLGSWPTGDCFHPNESGAEAIAAEVVEDALPLLGR